MDEYDEDLWLENIVSLELTQNEVFYLNDRLTMLTFSKRGPSYSVPTRKLKEEAAIGVPFQIILGSKSKENKFEFKEVNQEAQILSLEEIKQKLKK